MKDIKKLEYQLYNFPHKKKFGKNIREVDVGWPIASSANT